MGVIVLDPGHGGIQNLTGSDANHAVSPAGAKPGVKEKTLTLDLAQRILWSLTKGSGFQRAEALGKEIKVYMTRDSDVNVAGPDRARLAAQRKADLYLSLHFNGFNGKVRGTEAYIDRTFKQGIENADGTTQEGPGNPASGAKNINVDQDAAFASKIVQAAFQALRIFDDHSVLRSDSYSPSYGGATYKPPPGVKMRSLATLNDIQLQDDQNLCRACLLELEFIDHPSVDALYVTGPGAEEVRNAVAAAVAMALVEAL